MKTIPIDEIKVPMVEVTSINVAEIGHNAKQQILAIRFNNGGLYYYLDIPRSHFDNLLVADNIGGYLHRNIKGKFRYVRIN